MFTSCRLLGRNLPRDDQITTSSTAPAAGVLTSQSATVRNPSRGYISRARPTFLYVMYAMILWSIPIGLIAGIDPEIARQIADGTTRYLTALPEPLYALFGTGYLGYATLRQWGKAKGLER